MKKCPTCHSVFSFDTLYCLNDGTPLIAESALPPTVVFAAEEETLIKSRPVFMPPPAVPHNEPRTSSGFGKSFLFLVLGLILGGGLVLGIVFLIVAQMRKTEPPLANENFQTVANNKHKEPNKTRKDSEFNGFVKAENVNLRSAPNSTVVDILPKDDRVNLLERDGPWYRVICEHGGGGWVHGDRLGWRPDAIRF